MLLVISFIFIILVSCSKRSHEINSESEIREQTKVLSHGENPILKIGIPAPLSGGAAEYGEFIMKGATIAAEEINIQNNILKVQLFFLDSKGIPKEAYKAAERLITEEKVNVITCAFHSDATLAIIPIVKREKVPLVVAMSTADIITDPGNPYVFRVSTPNTRLSQLLGQYIGQKIKPKSVFYVYEKTEFGLNLADTMKNQLQKFGAKTVGYEGVDQHEANFLPLISKMKQNRPDMVFLGIMTDSAIPFLRQAKEAGYKTQWANAVSLSNPKFLDDACELAEGLIGITHFEASAAKGEGAKFVKTFQAKYDSIPTHYSAIYYDTIRMIADAARRGGVEQGKIVEALRTTNFNGITGHIKFDDHGQAHIGTIIFQWRKGKQKILKKTS
jgi:branched-chain amino acid transport system substrate-binding protein